MDAYFTKEKINAITEFLNEKTVVESKKVDNIEFQETGYKKGHTPPADGYRPLTDDFCFRGVDKHWWLHFKVSVPKCADGREMRLKFKTGKENEWDAINPQGILYINGKLVGGADVNHHEYPLQEGEYDIYFYLYSATVEGIFELYTSLDTVDLAVEKLYYDIKVPLEAANCFVENDKNRIDIFKHLLIAANMIDLRSPYNEDFYRSIKDADQYLATEFYGKACGESDVTVHCIGHTHIDVAWLWTLAQTVEKTQRSFSNVLGLMERYPEYKFMSSQPQLYAYLKESAPDVYEKVKEKVREGRWEVEGAMWLEADCNLISGESMVRQIIHGKRFMKEEFDVDSKTLWLPDVFGYSAAMPQILRKCGVDNFVTSKISWNEMNTMPYDTFMWEGIDGTEIFSNFLTAQDSRPDLSIDNYTNYNGFLRPNQVLGAWNRYQQKEYNKDVTLTYGYGDGGGGPTAWMLENQRRLSYGIPGFPKTKPSTTGEWLSKVRENFEKGCEELRRTPRWVGELYLELHRGTYTSVAKNKKNNRDCEFLLQKAESINAIAAAMGMRSDYPDQKLYSAWQTLLLNQFHDILPGSSIKEVYEDCDVDYAKIKDTANTEITTALDSVAANVKGRGELVYNPTGYNMSGLIEKNGELYETPEISAFGYKVVDLEKAESRVQVIGPMLENDYYTLVLDKAGRIKTLYDKVNCREVLIAGAYGNEFRVFEDFPKTYDNWEISRYYNEKMWILDSKAEITPFTNNVGAGFVVERDYLDSKISQTIQLYNNSRRIDFKTEIDWKQDHQILKIAFPLDVHTNKATYDIQFGNIERPTHSNTSWDAAKFEVCAHKWVDVSENGYGVALLNNCKYGFNTVGSTVSLTVLKCGTNPNVFADRCHHEFTYSLLPHSGDFREGLVQKEAYCLNNPMVSKTIDNADGTLADSYSAISCDCPNVTIDTLKKAYDGSGYVARLFDSFDCRKVVKLKVGFEFTSAYLCDMLENEIKELEVRGDEIILPLKNFEIATIKIK